uniref:Ubiquitin carboxyl-terminal hydrolase n=1 Tax=Cyprinus carpio TaxID=7962 RepID=A0A8C2K4R4_CYPCA
MFGDLFEEDGDGFSSSTSGTGVKGRECEPPPPRGKIRFCGIKNQGGTCYLNSLIQTLLFTPEFREELFRLGPDELGCLADKDKPEAKVRVIPLELQRLFSHLLLVDEQTASTKDLTDSFGWTNNEEMGQQDVQELNRILFSALESSLVGTSGSSLIHRLYHGMLVNQITCKECGNISERQEDFLDLTVSVRGVSGLEEALWNMFVEEEMFEGNNLYRCSRCEQLVRAAKSAKLRKLPPFLTISLLRFNFDFAKCERYKETGSYVFPLTFDLKPFCEQNNWPDSEYSYELFSVIIHKGGCYGGHYHVYIKDIDQIGHWEKREDKVGERKKENENSVDAEDPLSVLTGILAQEESKCVLVDQLGQKLMNKTGTPWSKKYKKQYGTISKFLQNHPEVFMLVSNGTRVALKAAVPATTDPSPTEPVNTEATDGCHWFDLNDSTVTAVTVKDIEKQFQGKESAYMLFYRKTAMKRPPEGMLCVCWTLLEMVQEENARLQQRRAEFDASSNSIEVRLHLAPHYHWQNGALHALSPNEDSIITVTFDRRRTMYVDCNLKLLEPNKWVGDADGSGLVHSMKGFAGGATLGIVLEALGPQEAFLCQEQSRPGASGGGASGWRVFPPLDMQRTLRELSLKDGDLCSEKMLVFKNAGSCYCSALGKCCRWRNLKVKSFKCLLFNGTFNLSGFLRLKHMFLYLGESWHLRRVDWCEEIGEPLTDENASLKEAKVIHGDTLVLVEGRLPPKIAAACGISLVGACLCVCVCVSEGSGSEMRFIGHVEISEEASLDDLKTQMMTLPALQDVCVPSSAFLRVWLLEGKKLARILRGNQQTLRKLKLGNGAEVCVERLMKEEDLGLKDLLLRVQMGVPGEKAYYPSEEFLWDAGRDSTSRGLYAALASRYGLTPDSLLLAKHLPDKHTWMPISNWTQQVSKRKKKRKAESLQAAPFYLKDGDIVGVKLTFIKKIYETMPKIHVPNHNTRCIFSLAFIVALQGYKI